MKAKTQTNGFFEAMTKQAMDEVTCGEKGWKDIDPNTVTLACFGHLASTFQSMAEQQRVLMKPIWFVCGILLTAVIGGILAQVLA